MWWCADFLTVDVLWGFFCDYRPHSEENTILVALLYENVLKILVSFYKHKIHVTIYSVAVILTYCNNIGWGRNSGMGEKDRILDAWITVESLAEGDIKTKDKKIIRFDSKYGCDFYAQIHEIITKKTLGKTKENGRNKKWGIAVYFDVFCFEEVRSILREQYHLQATDEELSSNSNKFSFAICFDSELSFVADKTFYTASGYIRKFKEIPEIRKLYEQEKSLGEYGSQIFDDLPKVKDKFKDEFNVALVKILEREYVKAEDCYFEFLENIESGMDNLHSFFIDDLEMAKRNHSDNVDSYLYGNDNKHSRVDLNSAKMSENFNPQIFNEILQPQNYPLGRFPSNIKYSLSFMQQVAVNLAIGFDNNQMRSVNGPPGTGKTTLLRDIFAQFIVQQAYDIAKLPDHNIKGNEETQYYKNGNIGEIPVNITRNGILVTSTNNTAVKNIVNEMPLAEGIDESLIQELKNADYFYELANSKLSSEWEEDESGEKKGRLIPEPYYDRKEFWGLFSMEGGKKDNMSQIVMTMKHIYKYVKENPLSDDSVYDDYIAQYKRVVAIRSEKQKFADMVKEKENLISQIEQAQNHYIESLKEKTEEKDVKSAEIKQALDKLKEESKELIYEWSVANRKLEEIKELKEREMEQKSEYECQKPGFFTGWKRKKAYKKGLAEIELVLNQTLCDITNCERTVYDITNKQSEINMEKERCQNKLDKCLRDFEKWKDEQNSKIAALESEKEKYEQKINDSNIKPLDMNLEYEELQMSNPWFDEFYRREQSKLFIMALRVRKQFLYDNKKNIRAAHLIWERQEDNKSRSNSKRILKAAWDWINMAIPVISTTFASLPRMCKDFEKESIGHLFVDEAGQALPQAAVGAIYRSRDITVVGDPSQIPPVLTLDSRTLGMLREQFKISEKYLSAQASVQTLTDEVSKYGFYRDVEKDDDSWIGIPLWVHRRCSYPMFSIANKISYGGLMVQGAKKNGKAEWFDIKGTANDKYVEKQGNFLQEKLENMMEENSNTPNEVYVITPFKNVAYNLVQKLKEIKFVCYDGDKPINVGTIHTFQGKEAKIVFLVLGADGKSKGAAQWAVKEPNIMNVAATRAKEEFFIIGDKDLYLDLAGDVIRSTYEIIAQYNKEHPDSTEYTPYLTI